MRKRYIVLLVSLVMLLSITACKQDKQDGAETLGQTEPSLPSNTSAAAEEYLVQFQTADGIPIYAQRVEQGGSVMPPTPPRLIGQIFSGWDGDYTNISGNTVITARYNDISDKKNVIVTDTVYSFAEREFDIAVGIYGDVCFCGLDMTLTYDHQTLTYVGAKNIDGGVIVNDTEEGKILFNFLSMRNTDGEVEFMQLTFQTKNGQKMQTELLAEVKSIYAMDTDGNPVEVSYEIVPNKIIIEEAENEA